MSNGPDDRVKKPDLQAADSIPKVYVTIDGENFMKLSMETYYGEGSKGNNTACSEHNEAGAVCSCNKVCTCNPQCSCQNQQVCTCNPQCSCQSYKVCTCNPQCSCQSHKVCSCNPQCSCQTVSNHGGGCSCNKVCTCVPVH